MRHLTDEQFIDLAEGLQDPALAPEARARLSHVESCGACAEQLESVRRVLKLVADAPESAVPEPSPLFWDHLSARVHEAVASQPVPRSDWFGAWGWRIAVPSAAVAALAVAVFLRTSPPVARQAQPVNRAVGLSDVPVAATADATLDTGSPALALLSDLAGDFEWDDVSAGLATGPSAIDRAMTELTPDEQIELHRLLNEELARWKKTPGA